ncbi:hypothetical protein D7D52_02115 [Nocardia yunnanensis]|uniref:Uncharacterized protein n=1 Tax=Nocardia yunnanensis TaxID=2382165 RepID=A0A386Z5D3_9NOCA|nr:hypothetical protein D7D52_02115 [Nocardia yunnanensis]
MAMSTSVATPTTTADRAAGLGVASKTACSAFLAKSQTDKEALLRQIAAENPGWHTSSVGELGVSWAEMNCNGKGDQAIGVALDVNPSTEVHANNVADMTCHDFLIQDTDDDTGIALMQQLRTEKPGVGAVGPFGLLVEVRLECKKPGADTKPLSAVAK